MSTPTYYDTLGLAPSASSFVVKAAYKALVLVHHPDKTLHLPPKERADHAAAFRNIQEAYDVLNDHKLKAAYDTELKRHNNRIDPHRSTFHPYTSPRQAAPRSSTPRRRPSMRLTTPEEKAAIKARIDKQFEQIQEERHQRDVEEASMSFKDLKIALKIWKDLADEHKGRPVDQAHCQIKIHEYEQKIRQCEMQQENWLHKLATPKVPPPKANSPADPTPETPNTQAASTRHDASTAKLAAGSSSAGTSIPPTTSRVQRRAAERKRLEEQRVAADAARASVRAEEKARVEAAKQAHIRAKAAGVRAEKEKLQRKVVQMGQEHAERIAKARAKAASVCIAHEASLTTEFSPATASRASEPALRPLTKKTCHRCGEEHVSLAEWKKCAKQGTSEHVNDEDFFLTI